MPTVDVLIASGDFLEHGLAINKNKFPLNNWPEIKVDMRDTVQLIHEKADKFLPVIGNNDVIYHYQGANSTWPIDKNAYYTFLGELWGISNFEKGFYVHEISSELAVIGLNSVLWSVDNDNALNLAKE